MTLHDPGRRKSSTDGFGFRLTPGPRYSEAHPNLFDVQAEIHEHEM